MGAGRHLRSAFAAALAVVALAGCGTAAAPVEVVAIGAPTTASSTTTTTTTTLAPPRLDPPVLDAGDGQDVLARYDVVDGRLTLAVSGDDQPRYRARFERFRELIPEGFRERIVGYLVFEPDDDSVGFVSAADAANATWVLGLSDEQRDDRDLDATLLHESAHVLTLNETQLRTRWFGDCATFESLDGCLVDGAYLLDWVDRFWRDLLPELDAIDSTVGADVDELVEEFYARHRARFVRAYAATSPEEDIAETFSAWATGLQPRTPAIGDKFAFFDTHPVFLELRAAAQAAHASAPR